MKQMKTKIAHSDALLQQKERDILDWRLKWEKRDALDEKYTIQNRQEFEQHFGVKALAKDDKYLNFMRMY